MVTADRVVIIDDKDVGGYSIHKQDDVQFRVFLRSLRAVSCGYCKHCCLLTLFALVTTMSSCVFVVLHNKLTLEVEDS